jgi:hypothetical protein
MDMNIVDNGFGVTGKIPVLADWPSFLGGFLGPQKNGFLR